MKEEPRLDMCLYKVAEQILLSSCQLAPPFQPPSYTQPLPTFSDPYQPIKFPASLLKESIQPPIQYFSLKWNDNWARWER